MRSMLQKRAASRGQGQSGFTLIELLVVIAILAVLAGVVVFAVAGITDNGEDSACAIERRTVNTAVQAFRAESGAYPTAIGDLVPTWLESAPTLTPISGYDATGATAPTVAACP